jgi:hypothetical protein
MRKETVSRDNLETIEWLSGMRWPTGPVCQGCQKKDTSRIIQTRGLYQCTECRHQFSVFSGTRFEGTRLSPFKLSAAIIFYWKESQENYEANWEPTPAEFKAKDYSRRTIRWKGPIGVRALERGIGNYATAQRLHKKLATLPFDQSISLEKFIKGLMK